MKEVYEKALYEIDILGEKILLKVGETSEKLDSILKENQGNSWALITPFNPQSRLLSKVENERRFRAFKRFVNEEKMENYPSKGLDPKGIWPVEEGLLLLDVSEERALHLGKKWEQKAILVGSLGTPVELKWCE